MSIFTQQHIDDVQEVIKKSNGQGHITKKMLLGDEEAEVNRQNQRIQQLMEEVDSMPEGQTKEMMQDCIQDMLSFYGFGLSRILDIISNSSSAAAKDIYNKLIEDGFVSSLLLIHELHPLDLKTRLHVALEKVRPYIDGHGGHIEILSLENGIAKIKLSGNCKGCPSSENTLELGIKKAVEECCPDLLGLEVEGVE
ncbi:MAG TPA: NifU family protein [Puia sp.]|nr:NifU family protein [Puia sp.]